MKINMFTSKSTVTTGIYICQYSIVLTTILIKSLIKTKMLGKNETKLTCKS